MAKIEMRFFTWDFVDSDLLADRFKDDPATGFAVFQAIQTTAKTGKVQDVPEHAKPYYNVIKDKAIGAFKKAHIKKVRQDAQEKSVEARKENKAKRETETVNKTGDGSEDPAPVFKLPNQKDFVNAVIEWMKINDSFIDKEFIIDFYKKLKKNKGKMNKAAVRSIEDCCEVLVGYADERFGDTVDDWDVPSEGDVAEYLFGAFDGCRDSEGRSQANTIAYHFLSEAKETETWETQPSGDKRLQNWQEKAIAYAEKQRDEQGFFQE